MIQKMAETETRVIILPLDKECGLGAERAPDPHLAAVVMGSAPLIVVPVALLLRQS